MSAVPGCLCFVLLVLVACPVDALDCFNGRSSDKKWEGARSMTTETCKDMDARCAKVDGDVIENGENVKITGRGCVTNCEKYENVADFQIQWNAKVRSISCCKGDLCNHRALLAMSPALSLLAPLFAILSFHF